MPTGLRSRARCVALSRDPAAPCSAEMTDLSACATARCPWQHILIVDDHALFRAGVVQLLRQGLRRPLLSEAHDIAEAEAVLRAPGDTPVDLVLLDLGLTDTEGLPSLHALREVAPEVAVIVVSGQADAATALACVQAGAMGYIHKSTDSAVFMDTVAGALQGAVCLPESLARGAAPDVLERARRLSPRQKDVLVALLQGQSNKRIALTLGVAESTVKTHLTEVMRALDVQTRVQALVAMAGVPLQAWR